MRPPSQDPAYPVYVDSSVMFGRTGVIDDDTKQYEGITYMPCTPDNDFFPDLTPAKDSDIILFCNPNNPTGACASRVQLESLVAFALENNIVIVYDSAYAPFIQDPDIPKSIFEIEGSTPPLLPQVYSRSAWGLKCVVLCAVAVRHGRRQEVRDRVLLALQARGLHRRPARLDSRAQGAGVRRWLAGRQGLGPDHGHPLQRRRQRGAGATS